jgi:hypothetical protein
VFRNGLLTAARRSALAQGDKMFLNRRCQLRCARPSAQASITSTPPLKVKAVRISCRNRDSSISGHGRYHGAGPGCGTVKGKHFVGPRNHAEGRGERQGYFGSSLRGLAATGMLESSDFFRVVNSSLTHTLLYPNKTSQEARRAPGIARG